MEGEERVCCCGRDVMNSRRSWGVSGMDKGFETGSIELARAVDMTMYH